jgi:hypothetical protein
VRFAKKERKREMSKKQNAKLVEFNLESLPTTSAKIRYLDSKGMKRGEIAKKLEIRYQHVRNVLITPLKKTS